MCTLHLEVPIHETAVERMQIDAPCTFVVFSLGTGKNVNHRPLTLSSEMWTTAPI